MQLCTHTQVCLSVQSMIVVNTSDADKPFRFSRRQLRTFVEALAHMFVGKPKETDIPIETCKRALSEVVVPLLRCGLNQCETPTEIEWVEDLLECIQHILGYNEVAAGLLDRPFLEMVFQFVLKRYEMLETNPLDSSVGCDRYVIMSFLVEYLFYELHCCFLSNQRN